MTILILAPHADDETLGVGGTIARRVAEGERVVVAVLTGRQPETPLLPGREPVDVRSECVRVAEALGFELLFRDLPAACLDYLPAHRINAVVHELIDTLCPDELYTPFAHDLHRDHGAVAYAASVSTRAYLKTGRRVRRVLAYETPSETHLAPPGLQAAFEPNVFVDISAYIDDKLNAMRLYESQIQSEPLPRSPGSLKALARWRGSHIGVDAAEAFMLLHEHC